MLESLGGPLSSGFMPHGHCYLWTPILVGLEVVSNAAIGLSYLSISLTLAHVVRKVEDLPFQWVYIAFAVFTVACGFTHLLDVWVIWRPDYWLDAAVRLVTAVASVGTAVLLIPLVPKAIGLAGAARIAHQRGVQLEQLNVELGALYEQARETLAEAIPQLVWTNAPDGQVDFLNQRWVDYTGDRALGGSWARAVHPDDLERVVRTWKESLATGRLYETEYRLRRSDGIYRWFLARGMPLRSEGTIVKWFGTCTDIDEQKKLGEERARLLARAEDDLRARDVFLALAAHELRTPLTPLRIDVEGLLRSARTARAERMAPERLMARLGRVDQQVHRLENLVDRLLDVARLTAGPVELDRRPVDLAALVREVVDRHRGELEGAGCAVTLHLPASAVGVFDRLRLDVVLTNLLLNALTYGRGRPITVELSIETGSARVAVADEGVGVALEDQARIFERFERAASERHTAGLGLGLWLVQKLVRAHGGEVSVESAPGRGARFTVRLPLEPPRT